MDFGLMRAPATWQRAMNTIFSGLLWKHCLIYIDDLLIYSSTFEDHLANIRLCLTRARERRLKFRPSKCNLFMRKIDFLGHELSSEGVHTSEKKVRAIATISTPDSPKQALSFVCLAGYYRKFIKNFAEISRPIHQAVHAETWEWTKECQVAFDTLKKALVQPPILAHPDFGKEFGMECDASKYQIGMILSQKDEENRPRVVCYASRMLTKQEQNYSATERECLAVVEGVRIFRPYLHGNKFQIVTDHKALIWLHNHKDQKSKLMRWALELQEYDYTIIHRPGKDSANVDALSRLHHDDDLPELKAEEEGLPYSTVRAAEMHSLSEKGKLQDLREAQARDPLYAKIVKYMAKGELPINREAANKVVAEAQHMEMDSGVLYHI